MPPPSLGIANWTASSPETLTPPGSSNFFTNKRIVWILIAGVILLAAIALGLCLLKSRCCGGRQVTYKMTSRDKLGAFATKNPKYKEYLLQSNNQMEKGNSFLSHLLFKNFVKPSFVSCYYQYIYIPVFA